MYSFELFEAGKPRVVVVYPGRFQPFHQGHAGVFHQLQKKFGKDNVFIASSNDQKLPKSPFNFSDKVQLMAAAGVPADKIIETSNMYKLPPEFDPASTIYITVVGAPDATRLAMDTHTKTDIVDKKTGQVKPAGSPSYFKSWDPSQDHVTADQHGYVVVIPEIHHNITLNGKQYDTSHGTEVRKAWNVVRNDPKLIKQFLSQLYEYPNQNLVAIFNKIPAETTAEDIAQDGQSTTSPIHGGTVSEDAAGVGVVATNKKMAKDPRYSMSITKDVKPNTPKEMLRAFRLAEENIDPTDFEIRNFDKLDKILINCCEMIIEGQKENSALYGMVAACVLDPENRAVYGVNTFDDATDTRKHAERIAIENYTKQFGSIPKGSIIITTLSPCCHPMEERYGESCTDLINDSGVHKVYCGYKDPTQEHGEKLFHTMCTRNEKIEAMCKKFADTFLEENFADGRNPQDKGDSRRYNIPKKAKISTLRKIAKQGGRRGQLAHWQANMRSGRQKTNEDTDISEKDMMAMIKKFLPVAMHELKLKKLPRFIIQPHVETHGGQATFGRFVDKEETIYLGIADRHPVDILRTLAHELVHFKQHLEGRIHDGAGDTGSPIENEAHAVAGVIMRHFNKKYPDAISAKGLELPRD